MARAVSAVPGRFLNAIRRIPRFSPRVLEKLGAREPGGTDPQS